MIYISVKEVWDLKRFSGADISLYNGACPKSNMHLVSIRFLEQQVVMVILQK